jgi:hypothetical protein
MGKLLIVTAAVLFTTSAMACSIPELCAVGREAKIMCSKPFDFERIENITENWGLSAVKEVAQRCQSVGMYMKIEVKK